jgi:pyruvate dehydrogenase E2 component (dihydrolipoamide acetyltransferase)
MAKTQVVMPKMSMTMTEGEVVEITVSVGDMVSAGQVVAVVGTDKTDMEVESDHEGEVIEILAGSGDVLPVGAGLILLETKGEDLLAGLFGSSEPAAETAPEPAAPAEPVAPIAEVPASQASEQEILAMPGARRLAKELGIDLGGVKPASISGVIKQSDLAAKPDQERLDKARLLVAKVVETALAIPQFSITSTLTLTNPLPKDSTKRLIVLTSAWRQTLLANPKLNSTFDGQAFSTPAPIRVAVLLKTRLGFVSPVLGLSEGWQENFESVLRAAQLNKIALENLTGATTSITDLSDYSITQANTLLFGSQSSGLNLGKSQIRDGAIEIDVTIVLDHRVADPGDAATALIHFGTVLQKELDGNG